MKNLVGRNRDFLFKIYNPLYKQHSTEPANKCFYCGDQYHDIDHCPPLKTFDYTTTEHLRIQKIPLVKINACRDCNNTLGSKPIFTAYERALYIEKKLTERYEKKFVIWHRDELQTMSTMFQNIINAKQRHLETLSIRIQHAQWRILQTESFPTFDKEEKPSNGDSQWIITKQQTLNTTKKPIYIIHRQDKSEYLRTTRTNQIKQFKSIETALKQLPK